MSARNGGAGGQQLVEDRTQSIDVGRRPQPFSQAAGLLGGHVAGRSHDRAAQRDRAILAGPLGQAKVSDIRASLAIEQDVGWLQVAMEEAAFVGVLDRAGDGRHQASGRLGVVPGPRSFLRLDLMRQALSFDQFHAEDRGSLEIRRPRRSARCAGGRGWRPARPRGETARVRRRKPSDRTRSS